jgi:hypothetical protein
VVRFRVEVASFVGEVGVGFYFLKFIRRGGGMEKVSDAFLTFVFYGVRGHVFGGEHE